MITIVIIYLYKRFLRVGYMNKEKLKEIVNMAIELRDKDIMVHLFKNNDLI